MARSPNLQFNVLDREIKKFQVLEIFSNFQIFKNFAVEISAAKRGEQEALSITAEKRRKNDKYPK